MKVESWKLWMALKIHNSTIHNRRRRPIQNSKFKTQKSRSEYNICISNRSKLRVERTKKSLVRKSRVLSGFRYVSYTQHVTPIVASWWKQPQRKRTPFALQKDSFCPAKQTLLHSNCSRLAYVNGNFGSRKVPFCDKNGAISAPSTHKNATRNLYNQIFICNTFLLPWQYLHPHDSPSFHPSNIYKNLKFRHILMLTNLFA